MDVARPCEQATGLALFALLARVDAEAAKQTAAATQTKGKDAIAKPPQPPQQPQPQPPAKQEEAPPGKKEKPPPVEYSTELLGRHAKVVAVGEECIEQDELLACMHAKPGGFRLYDGFEPSGRMHIAQGVFKSLNVNTCTAAGGEFVFWVADFFALMNDKMSGDLEKIKVVGEYLVEVWKAAGMNMDKVKFVWASQAIVERSETYARIMCDIARRYTVARLVKCCQIMGRKEGNLSAAQILYPIMQCADVFFLEADVCQLGVDQRKVNILAREYAQLSARRFKPVILSHHMLFGLKQGQEKMSKSDADSAIFMEDTEEDVVRKISQAYCPSTPPAPAGSEGGADECEDPAESLMQNPCLDYVKHICLHGQEGAEFAGFKSFREVRAAFVSGELSEAALKTELASKINDKLRPVREHFASGRPKELLDAVKRFKQEDAAIQQAKREAQEKQQAALDGPDDDEAAGALARRRKKDALPPLRRCQPKVMGGKRASCVVFMPPPVTHRGVFAADVLDVAVRLTRAVSLQTEEERAEGEKVVLFVPDLGFICRNSLADVDQAKAAKRKIDDKGPFANVGRKSSPALEIEAYVDAFLGALRAVVRDWSAVIVMRQTDLMNEDPMNYLLSIINVGRSFKLERDVLPAVGIAQEAEGGKVGLVIDALFHVADVLALGPAKRVVHSPAQESTLNLAVLFFQTEFAREYDCGGEAPLKIKVEMPELRLLKTPEDTDVESFLYITDDDKSVDQKVNRAFCEPGNVVLNPVLNGLCSLLELPELRHVFGSSGGAPPQLLLQVKRSEQNGGNMDFGSVSAVFEAFAKGRSEGEFPPNALHPGDLKAAVKPLIRKLVQAMRSGVPASAGKILDDCRKRNPVLNLMNV